MASGLYGPYARFRPPEERPVSLPGLIHMGHVFREFSYEASWSTPSWRWPGIAFGLDLCAALTGSAQPAALTWCLPLSLPSTTLLQSVLWHVAQPSPQHAAYLPLFRLLVLSRLTVYRTMTGYMATVDDLVHSY